MHKKINLIFLALTIILVMQIKDTSMTISDVRGQPIVPYNLGNWTYISKPMLPIAITYGQIPIGENWTFVCNLNEGSLYHVYFYGTWCDNTSLVNKTDYDIYVYDPLGNLESIHTESAGLPEHLGTTVDEPYFIPKHSGDYSFLIKNDPRESKEQKGGTLMLIEHLQTNHWYEHYIQGKVNDKPVENTSWAYEFLSSSDRIKVFVDVPDTLDMYEVQLYLMATPILGVGDFLSNAPIPWEPGLYGNLTVNGNATYGGYKLDMEGIRTTNASASCEYFGEDMLIDFKAPNPGNVSLYHLALIGEYGEGVVKFIVQTDFTPPSLSILDPIVLASSNEDITIIAQAIDNETSLMPVLLNYTNDNWKTLTSVEMTPSQNHTYTAMIPRQPGGTTVRYKVIATDIVGNTMTQEAGYKVKDLTTLTLSTSSAAIFGGDSIIVTGGISRGPVNVTLEYTYQSQKITKLVQATLVGYFEDTFTPQTIGLWRVSASWGGDEIGFATVADQKIFTVQKTETSITCDSSSKAVTIGGDLSITGLISPQVLNLKVSLRFTKPDGTTTEKIIYTSSDGSFDLTFRPDLPGSWSVQAYLSPESDLYYTSYSNPAHFVVYDTWFNTYKMYIIALPAIAVVAVSGTFLIFRSRRAVVVEEEEEEE